MRYKHRNRIINGPSMITETSIKVITTKVLRPVGLVCINTIIQPMWLKELQGSLAFIKMV